MTPLPARDPLLLTLPEAAALVGMNRRTFWLRLRNHPEFRAAIDTGLGGERYISRPRLEAWVRGDPVGSSK